MDFRNSNLDKVSFEAATLNGFTLPSNWQLNGGCLCSQGNRNKPILIDEKVLQNKKGNIAFTFQMAGNLFLNDQQKLKTLKKNIRIIKSTYFDGEIDIEQIPPEVINLLYYLPVIEQLLNDEFYPMFYQFVDHEEIELLKSIAATLSSQLQENKIESSISDVLQAFCFDFGVILYAFDAAINDETQNTYYQNIKPILFGRLKDQYLVLKEIYGNNGELGDEDRSYFSWMHYKNLYDFVTSKWYQRPAKIFKWLVFENIFGWGVDLFRIFGSTLLLVLIFSGIYWLGGQISPEVSIRWDDLVIPISKLNYGNILLLTFQTTFAAFMGDWSPAGLGSMKIWMTLNAVLGVLLVAFLIGAYGRKMLR